MDDQPNQQTATEAPPVVATPPTPQFDWSQAPAPGPSSYTQSGTPTTLGGLIPTDNPPSLWCYYLGILALFPLFTPFLAPVSFVQGRKALKRIREYPGMHGKGHVIVGFIFATLGTIIFLFLAFGVTLALISESRRR